MSPSLVNEVHDAERGGESTFSPRSSGSWPAHGRYFTRRNSTAEETIRRTSFFSDTLGSPAPDLGHLRDQVVSPGGGGGGLRSICRGVFCGRWFVSRGIGGGARIFQEQFLRLGSEGENRYSLGLSNGSGAEADASISCLPSVNNTPPLYCAERMTAFSVSCASPRIAV